MRSSCCSAGSRPAVNRWKASGTTAKRRARRIPASVSRFSLSEFQSARKRSCYLMSVHQLVPDRSEIDKDQRYEDRQTCQYTEGAHRGGRERPHKESSIRDE